VMTDRSVIAYPAILHFSESRHYIREVSPANTMAYDSPPEKPTYDALFRAASHAMSFTKNCGFYKTLRSDSSRGVKSVSNTVACVADLLQDKGQDIYHIL